MAPFQVITLLIYIDNINTSTLQLFYINNILITGLLTIIGTEYNKCRKMGFIAALDKPGNTKRKGDSVPLTSSLRWLV
jgi:hypothetical protein